MWEILEALPTNKNKRCVNGVGRGLVQGKVPHPFLGSASEQPGIDSSWSGGNRSRRKSDTMLPPEKGTQRENFTE